MKVLLAAVVLVASAMVPARAQTRAPGEIVLTGDSSVSAEMRLEHPVRLRCCVLFGDDSGGRMVFRIIGMEVETSGTFAGFAIERVRDGRIMKGAVRVPAMDLDDGTVPAHASFGRARRLPPGDYRIHLLTDGPSTVRIEAEGAPDDLRLTRPRPSSVSASLVTLATESGPQKVQDRVPIEVRAGATVVLMSKTEGDYAQAHYFGHCLTAPGGQCSSQGDYEYWVSPSSGGGGGVKADPVEGLDPGRYDAVFTAGSAGLPQGSYGFVLVVG